MMRAPVAALCLSVLLAGCAIGPVDVAPRLDALLPADVILLGEQHDAPEHQELQRAMVLALAQRGQLAALALEMAEQGRSTAALPADASVDAVYSALNWNAAGWPWSDYSGAVMAAVRAGVPVLGANLARSAMAQAMTDESLDRQVSAAALAELRDDIQRGHCGLLAQHRLAPMTRIQIARDASMAATVVGATQSGKTVLMVAGNSHTARASGIPAHLPETLRTRIIHSVAGKADDADHAEADLVWETALRPPKDYCAGLAKKLKP